MMEEVYSLLMVIYFFQGNSNTVFSNNTASEGGGVSILMDNLFFQGNSNTVFSNNTAHDDGGGVFIADGNLFFSRKL